MVGLSAALFPLPPLSLLQGVPLDDDGLCLNYWLYSRWLQSMGSPTLAGVYLVC